MALVRGAPGVDEDFTVEDRIYETVNECANILARNMIEGAGVPEPQSKWMPMQIRWFNN